MHDVLTCLALILVLGISAQWVASRLRIPSILLLLTFGLIAGPVAGWIQADKLFGDLLQPIVALSVAVILFEGGLSLKLSDLRDIGGVFLRLCTLGVVITWVISAIAAHYLEGLSWELATLIGAILVVTGPTVIGPLLRHLRMGGQVGAILRWEGIVIDPVGAVLAVMVFAAIHHGEIRAGTVEALIELLRVVVVGSVLGFLGAYLLIIPLRRYWIADLLQNPVALMMVVAMFAVSNRLQEESGLLTVTIMGIVVANQRNLPIKHLIEFKENLSVLLISSLFIVLAARLRLEDLKALNLGSVGFVLVLVLLARPAAVLVSAVGTALNWRERVFLACMAPRGIVAAAVTSVFALKLQAEGYANADRLVPITFAVILATVALYGLGSPWVARTLGLAVANPQGILFVGAHPMVRELALAVQKEGIPVLLVDSDRQATSAARLAGVRAYHGSIMAEQTIEEIDFGQMGRLIAWTPNDEVNALACQRFVEIFGRREVYQLPPVAVEGRQERVAAEHRGRLLFGPDWTYERLIEHFGTHPKVKATRLTKEFTFAAYKERHGESVLPVMLIRDNGTLALLTQDQPPTPQAGQLLLSLVNPAKSENGNTETG